MIYEVVQVVLLVGLIAGSGYFFCLAYKYATAKDPARSPEDHMMLVSLSVTLGAFFAIDAVEALIRLVVMLVVR